MLSHGYLLGRRNRAIMTANHGPGRDRCPGPGAGRLGQHARGERALRGGQHRSLSGSQAVGHAAGKHALLDVAVDVARRTAGIGHEVENGGRVGRCHARPRYCGRQLQERLARVRKEGVDIDQRLDIGVAGSGVGDDKSVGQVADHFAAIAGSLSAKPVIIGHSFGGLLAQILAGRGLAAATVAIDPAPFGGVLPLPISALRVAGPALSNPANRHRAVPLTYDQFRYAFANAVTEDEAKQLYEAYAVPAAALPLFQGAAANLNPWTEAKVDTENPGRGPMLLISGEKDHTAPPAITHASYKLQQRNAGVTETVQMPGRRHALIIDHGWREVADTALAFVQRFSSPRPGGAGPASS
jgi:non-heme chloroperoxidase